MLPDKILKKRKEYGLSQFALSKRSTVSRFKISQYELGYGELTKEEKQKIKQALTGAKNDKNKKSNLK